MMQQRTYRRLALALIAVSLATGAAWAHDHEKGNGEEEAAEVPAATTFERLKGLNGTWKDTGEALEGTAVDPDSAFQIFRVSSGGTVVMETMAPGTDYEMINMYHLDGEDLVLTHYCAAGNQPTMRLAKVSEDGNTLHFAFTGGTNLDPAADDHIHEASITFLDANTIEERWMGYSDGKPGEALMLTLHRVE